VRRALLLTLVTLFALPAAGCAGQRQLVAEDGSHRLIARDPASGMTIVLTTEAFEGRWNEKLTIVHVLVANQGQNRVLLAPGDFEMRDGRGFRYDLRDAGGSFSLATQGGQPSQAGYDPGGDAPFEAIRSSDGELERLALPWGTLEPGTQMRGFLYFDDIRGAAHQAVLTWTPQSPEHQPLGRIAFRLHIAE
jgi:hypothetical protein